LPDDRQHTNRVPHREQVQRARQAAEALFRPKRQPASIEATIDPPPGTPSPSTKRDTPRAPQILSATPVSSISADQPQIPISSAPRQRWRTDTRKARKIQHRPRSHKSLGYIWNERRGRGRALRRAGERDSAHCLPVAIEPILSGGGHADAVVLSFRRVAFRPTSGISAST
jgi:hypothetical protein